MYLITCHNAGNSVRRSTDLNFLSILKKHSLIIINSFEKQNIANLNLTVKTLSLYCKVKFSTMNLYSHCNLKRKTLLLYMSSIKDKTLIPQSCSQVDTENIQLKLQMIKVWANHGFLKILTNSEWLSTSKSLRKIQWWNSEKKCLLIIYGPHLHYFITHSPIL